DNRDPTHLTVTRPTQSFAQRIFIWKILAHKRFIRDANKRRLLIEILRPKIATLLQRNLHDFEVVADDTATFQTRLGTGRDRRPDLSLHIAIEGVAAEWKLADHCGLHTRQRIHSGEDLFAEACL